MHRHTSTSIISEQTIRENEHKNCYIFDYAYYIIREAVSSKTLRKISRIIPMETVRTYAYVIIILATLLRILIPEILRLF